jgi:hypothetical protein
VRKEEGRGQRRGRREEKGAEKREEERKRQNGETGKEQSQPATCTPPTSLLLHVLLLNPLLCAA